MAEIRTLKLNLLADIDQFTRGMKGARGDVDNLGYKLGNFAKQATKYFAIAAAAAGAFAVKIGVDSVKAAVEDEKSQVALAKALENTTGATQEQIRANEKFIRTQQLAFGVADTQLRPAVANLARATGDLKKAQDLTNLSLDISAATGKDLESVSLAIGKAYNGNIGALTRLGVPLDENIKKTKDFNVVQEKLTQLFGGAAAANAQTYAGQLAITSQNVGELKESIGVLLLPAVSRLAEYANNTLIPTLQKVADGFAGKPDSVSNKLKQVGRDMGYAPDSGAYNLGVALRDVADAMGRLIGEITSSDAQGAPSTLQKLADALTTVAKAIDAVTNAWNRAFGWIGSAGIPFKFSPGGINAPQTGRALGGSVSAGMPVTVGEMGKEVFIPSQSGSIVPNNKLGGNITVNLNGIIDGESARRTIEKLLQDSARRTGAINLLGATL